MVANDIATWRHACELLTHFGDGTRAAVTEQFDKMMSQQDYRGARHWLNIAHMVEALTDIEGGQAFN